MGKKLTKLQTDDRVLSQTQDNVDRALGQQKLDTTAAVAAAVPTGVIFEFAGKTAPTGFLLCDGSLVSRLTYAALFAVIGTTYGAGNGTTTFAIPDRRGRAAIGAGQGSGLTSRTLGATGGEEAHTLTTAEMPAHSHAPSNGGSFIVNGNSGVSAANIGTGAANWGQTTSNSQGGGGSHNNMQPFLVMNFIIKT